MRTHPNRSTGISRTIIYFICGPERYPPTICAILGGEIAGKLTQRDIKRSGGATRYYRIGIAITTTKAALAVAGLNMLIAVTTNDPLLPNA
jgi:hypothetical protein